METQPLGTGRVRFFRVSTQRVGMCPIQLVNSLILVAFGLRGAVLNHNPLPDRESQFYADKT